MHYVYILQSLKTGRYYIGSTNDVRRRLGEHNSGSTPSLKHQRPLALVFRKGYSVASEAKAVERKLKRYKSRSILERIISEKDILMGP
ncbi:MAG: GIY-YIG nuclease family protein [Patescibacteria group bacterium]|nr:GIY-YIG nuclease family protein [Patescibacteria group bacterium]